MDDEKLNVMEELRGLRDAHSDSTAEVAEATKDAICLVGMAICELIQELREIVDEDDCDTIEKPIAAAT